MSSFDVIVVGAGPAGLSCALYLARYDRSVVVFDAGQGRSSHHQVNHNYLGFPDGISAIELRRRGLAQLSRYDHVQVRPQRVTGISRIGPRFEAHTESESVAGRVVVLCTGVVDRYPQFPDWESYVGRSMFWCLTCDGFEAKGKQLVVVGHTDSSACEALQLQRFSSDVTMITNAPVDLMSTEWKRRLDTAGVETIHDQIADVEGSGGIARAVLTASGDRIPVEALFVVQGATPQSTLAVKMGIEVTDDGYVVTDTDQRTSIQGAFAAGDVTRLHSHQVSTAVHEGAQAASTANNILLPEALKAP